MIAIVPHLRRLLVISAMLIAAGMVASALELQGSEKSVYVILTDAQNKPAPPGAPAQAFKIREDNIDREVVKAEQIKEPMAVVFLTDTTSAFVGHERDLRTSSAAFTTRMLKDSPQSSVALWEFGGADIPIENFTSDAAKLEEASKKLFPKGTVSDVDLSGSAVIRGQNIVGSNLLEAIADASKALAKRPEARRMIVAFHSDLSVEMSTMPGQQIQNEVTKANASLMVISLQAITSNAKQRDNVLDNLCPISGGARITITTVQALTQTLENVADIIAQQYIVTYKRPSGAAKLVQVGIAANGIKASTAHAAPK